MAIPKLRKGVREGGRVVKIAVRVATGVNVEGYREVLGIQCATTESGAGWDRRRRGLQLEWLDDEAARRW